MLPSWGLSAVPDDFIATYYPTQSSYCFAFFFYIPLCNSMSIIPGEKNYVIVVLIKEGIIFCCDGKYVQ